MTSAPEIKYTDRDVREDLSLTKVATEYVKEYTGEFEPLVDAGTELEEHGELTPVTVRKVLNCMRHDRDWKGNLPIPKRRIPPVTDPVTPLLPIQHRRGKLHWTENYEKNCKKTQIPHEPHHWEDKQKEGHWCKGVAFKINRPYVIKAATRIKVPYAAAKQGQFVHMTEGTGFVEWHPTPHEWGWRYPESYRFQVPKDRSWNLVVRTRCKNPYRIKNPVLLSNGELLAYMENTKKIRNPDIQICPRCLPPLNG